MSSAAPYQLLITIVHGTWPDGVFRALLGRKLGRHWFDDGRSDFITRLSAELGGIPHRIDSFSWGGENSVFKRNDAAYRLAERLSAEHDGHPQAVQLVIAHSHGGNIALRALHYIQKQGGALANGAEIVTPLVVTLSTPFIEVHQADFGQRPALVRIAVFTAITTAWSILTSPLLEAAFQSFTYKTILVWAGVSFPVVIVFIIWWRWISRRDERQKQIEKLRKATRISEAVSTERLLVIRAVDDEAYLLIALGTIFTYAFATSIVFVIAVLSVVPFVAGSVLPILHLFYKPTLHPSWDQHTFQLACSVTIIGLWFGLIISRVVHGRELARSPMDCQINTQSAPDGTGIKIATLVSDKYVKWFGRHGIYERDDCAKAISDWIQTQLGVRCNF